MNQSLLNFSGSLPRQSLSSPIHCVKNNLNLRIKSLPVTAGADATVFVRLLVTSLGQEPSINCTPASAPTVSSRMLKAEVTVPKSNPNFPHKNRTYHGWSEQNRIGAAFVKINLDQKPDIYRCINQ